MLGNTVSEKMAGFDRDSFIISCSKDKTVRFWNPENGRTELAIQGHSNSVLRVDTACVNGQCLLATASGDRRARIWSYWRT